MTRTIDDIVAFGRARGACAEALSWLRTQSDVTTAWQACERPDWLIWWLKRQPATDRKTLVRIACACARTALRFVPDGEERPRLAIETTERWLVGSATIEDVRTAAIRAAAIAAATTIYAAAAAYAAAGDAAYAAAAYAAARHRANIQMCGIIRAHVGMDGGAI